MQTASLALPGRSVEIVDAARAVDELAPGVYARLPYSARILAENIARTEPDADLRARALVALARRDRDVDLPLRPHRVVLQDVLGATALVDLAGLRDAIAERGGDPRRVNPALPVQLVVDHSLNVEHSGDAGAMARNMEIERRRNAERFAFIAWAGEAFGHLSIVPSGNGILHQVNIERLTPVIATRATGDTVLAYPDTLVGTDSHTPMINAVGVLGWGVGGIEAEAAMLGKALALRLPEMVGVRLTGTLPAGYIATDIALALAEQLRACNVVGAFVEFCGPGVGQLTLADRSTIANMAPEFGATTALFAIDERTLAYLRTTARSPDACALVRAYAMRQGLWGEHLTDVRYDRTVAFDLSRVSRAIAGPRQPHQRIVLGAARSPAAAQAGPASWTGELPDGAVVIAAITSCTNTSNPRAVIAAGLVARKAHARGLKPAPWTKTSFAPGSRVVGDYLARAGLDRDLDALGFQIVGYACTTCNGMSGPLLNPEIEERIRRDHIRAVAVTSGNRNFEGRIHPLAREAFIMSPPLVVAYALAGNANIDPELDPLARDPGGAPVYLRELWPSDAELDAVEREFVRSELFAAAYRDLPVEREGAREPLVSALYAWDPTSTNVRRPPYWESSGRATVAGDLVGLRALVMLGDHVTTDHISPSGAILPDSPAGRWLLERGVGEREFNAYSVRRTNHEVGVRATFASPRLRNELVGDKEGPITRLLPEGREMNVFEAAQEYMRRGQSLLVIAGQNYGSGSSRDWAAKGPRLLGVRAVLAESFERIHRSNLAGMGVLPLQFLPGESRRSLGLAGDEQFDIEGVDQALMPRTLLGLRVRRGDGTRLQTQVVCRLDTGDELDYFRHGGMLPQMLGEFLASPP